MKNLSENIDSAIEIKARTEMEKAGFEPELVDAIFSAASKETVTETYDTFFGIEPSQAYEAIAMALTSGAAVLAGTMLAQKLKQAWNQYKQSQPTHESFDQTTLTKIRNGFNTLGLTEEEINAIVGAAEAATAGDATGELTESYDTFFGIEPKSALQVIGMMLTLGASAVATSTVFQKIKSHFVQNESKRHITSYEYFLKNRY